MSYHPQQLSPTSFDSVPIEKINYAFQPIINIHTGAVFGFEALMRDHAKLGFSSVHKLFDDADLNGYLIDLEITLRERAIAAFKDIKNSRNSYLFLNLDARLLPHEKKLSQTTAEILARHDISPACICYELTELHDVTSLENAGQIIDRMRRQHLLAIDDFGTGYSGLKLLYTYPPDLIKIDRFFVSSLVESHKKRLFVSNIVNLAHTLGIQVIAEGVETREELRTCRDIGCDLAQGFFIARPTTAAKQLKASYPEARQAVSQARRREDNDVNLIRSRIEFLPRVLESANMATVFDLFKRHVDLSFFPIVDDCNRPQGLICEQSLKSYIYSSYGRELLINKSYRKSLKDFITPCPSAEIDNNVERLLEIYVAADQPPGLIITRDFHYIGFISQGKLLQIVDSKNIAAARDQNPLTCLPGNNSIIDFITCKIQSKTNDCFFIYFDFNSFKPFNDTYGFRTGDRAIMLFAEILRQKLGSMASFIGHVGGDDFFAGIDNDTNKEWVHAVIYSLLDQFAHDVQSFYDADARTRGYIEGVNRNGEHAHIPLLSCSAAILHLIPSAKQYSLDQISCMLSNLKKQAKQSPGHVVQMTTHDLSSCQPYA